MGKSQIIKTDGQDLELVECYTFLGLSYHQEQQVYERNQKKNNDGKKGYVKSGKNINKRQKCY